MFCKFTIANVKCVILARRNVVFVNFRQAVLLYCCKEMRKNGAEVYIFETLRGKVEAGLFYRILAAFNFAEGVDLHVAGG